MIVSKAKKTKTLKVKRRLKQISKKVGRMTVLLGRVLELASPTNRLAVVVYDHRAREESPIDHVIEGFENRADAERWIADQKKRGSDLDFDVVETSDVGSHSVLTTETSKAPCATEEG